MGEGEALSIFSGRVRLRDDGREESVCKKDKRVSLSFPCGQSPAQGCPRFIPGSVQVPRPCLVHE